MSNERSKLWQNKKKQLDQKEVAIKEELEEVSANVENRVKNIFKISLISGVTALMIYGTYRFLFDKPDEETDKAKNKDNDHKVETSKANPKTSNISFKNIFIERLAAVGIKILGNAISEIISSKIKRDSSDD